LSNFIDRALHLTDEGYVRVAIETLESDFPVHDWHPGIVVLTIEFLKSERLDFRKFWPRVKDINERFKEVELPKAARTQLRDRLSRLCERAKEVQNLQNAEFDEKWTEAYWRGVSSLGELKREYDMCVFGNHGEVQTYRSEYSKVRSQLISLVHRTPDQKDKRQNLFDQLDVFRRYADERIDRMYETKRAKHEQWLADMRDNRARLQSNRKNKELLIANIRQQAYDLEVQITNARSDSFLQKAMGWLKEKQDFLSTLEDRFLRSTPSFTIWNRS
jgi:hypothetical protein